jgi:hypothetical protein
LTNATGGGLYKAGRQANIASLFLFANAVSEIRQLSAATVDKPIAASALDLRIVPSIEDQALSVTKHL